MTAAVREASGSDEKAIRDVIVAAFGQVQGREIAELVTGLLADPSARPLLSLVATINGRVVGHILFTNVRLANSQRIVPASLLAPLCVLPEYQNKGIGGQLIDAGVKRLKEAGVELVFVLGHPGYYPKYGFCTAGKMGLQAPYPIAPENADAWMVQALVAGVLGRVGGRVLCADVLNDPKHWQE